MLRETHLFRSAEPSDLEPLAEIVEEVSSPPGQHIFFQGDIATEFFVVAQGKVRVYVPGHGDELDLGIVGDGQMFGEGLLDGGPRVASAVTLEPSTILRFPRDQWLLVMDEIPGVRPAMLSSPMTARRIRQYTSRAVDFLFLTVQESPRSHRRKSPSEGERRYGSARCQSVSSDRGLRRSGSMR